MKKIRIKHTDLEVSNLVMGCMRIGELSEKELEELTETYLSEGVTPFLPCFTASKDASKGAKNLL